MGLVTDVPAGLRKQRNATFAWITDEYIVPLLRQDVVDRLREHQEQCHRVILLSGTFEDLLAVVGERLGVNEVVGTRLQAYVSEPGKTIDWAASYAYADSISDRRVLEGRGAR